MYKNFIKKNIIALLLMMTIFNVTACITGNNKNITTQNNSDIRFYNSKELNEIIIGEWGIYSQFYNDPIAKARHEVLCDACPIIDFKKDGTATLTYSEGLGAKEYYKWKVRGNKLKLKLIGKEKDSIHQRFENSEYRMEITSTEDSYWLKTFLTNESGHVLARGK